jgi:hypothetical protein
VTATGAVSMSRLSLQYILVPVNATKSGEPYNPTGDAVNFAFLLNPGGVPQVSDWVAGSWDTLQNYNYPYAVKCLVGPGGAADLASGTYVVWVQIIDSPEIPVLIAGQLQIV